MIAIAGALAWPLSSVQQADQQDFFLAADADPQVRMRVGKWYDPRSWMGSKKKYAGQSQPDKFEEIKGLLETQLVICFCSVFKLFKTNFNNYP